MRQSCRSLFAVLALLLVATPALAQEPAPEKPAQPAAATPPEKVEPERLVLPVGTRLALILANTVNTKNSAVGDPVYFETIYPVVLANRVVIPVGSFVRGSVTQVKRPGRVKGRGELHVRFDELTLPNGYTTNLSASLASAGAREGEEVDRKEGTIKGDSTKGEDIGTVATTTTAGAGIGAIAGGGKGTAIGAAAGAAAGLAAVLLTRGKELELPRGTTLDVVLDRSLELDPALATFEWTGQATSMPAPTPQQRQRNYPRYPW
jgi:type IV secretion system protein VirB10